MTQITRVYDSSKNATDAVTELKTRGFKDVALVTGSSNRSGRTNGAGQIDAITSAGIPMKYAEAYAERVQRGGAVVTVSAPFGTANTATEILNRYNPAQSPANGAGPGATPVPLGTETSSYRSGTESGSWTLSSALGIPELISSNTFFSGFPLLISSKPFSSLSRSQEPFSSLAASQKPFSELSRNQAGSANLINSPAPLSAALGLPVLVKDAHKAH
jgi:hypothetical protein